MHEMLKQIQVVNGQILGVYLYDNNGHLVSTTSIRDVV
jgi:hypothetical protein